MVSFLNFLPEDLKEDIKPSFRIEQIRNWIYNKYIFDFEQMLNLSQDFRKKLKEKFSIVEEKIIKKEESKDGSIKYLILLKDGKTIETVLLKMSEEKCKSNKILKQAKYTICVSSQVGCKMACAFCLTGKSGFERNLETSEIVSQVLLIKKDNSFSEEKSLNLVFMGMGEPLNNFKNLTKAIKIFAQMMKTSSKRQTVSTSGISPKIHKLGELDLGVQLAISLHAVDNKTRNILMPVNKHFPIETIISAVKKYPIDVRKRLMFEYIMIKDINDSLEDAKKLSKLLNGIKSKVNLIYFNPFEGTKFQRPSKESVEKFKDFLNQKKIICTIRESKGLDISAACGQLREKSKEIKQTT